MVKKIVQKNEKSQRSEEGICRIKIQRPLFSDSTNKTVLLYSRDGEIAPTLIQYTENLSKAMGDRLKAYFVARLTKDSVEILSETACDNW